MPHVQSTYTMQATEQEVHSCVGCHSPSTTQGGISNANSAIPPGAY